MRAIDTNVLVRSLVRDHPAQGARAERLLAEGDIFVPITVILELEWVLRSRYGFWREVVAQTLHRIAALENVVVGDRDAVISAAARHAQGWVRRCAASCTELGLRCIYDA